MPHSTCAQVDPEFRKKLNAARSIGSVAFAENAINAACGGELSSGSIERDKLILEAAKWWNEAMGKAYGFGEHIQVDSRVVQVTYTKIDTDIL